MAEAAQNDNISHPQNEGEVEEKPPSEGEELLQRVRNLMQRVTAARSSPHPRFLHTLAAILEEEESRFEKDAGHSISNTSRLPHNAGRLSNLIRDNDDFFELLSSKLLVEPRISTAVKAAAARLLLACLSCGMYSDALNDTVLSNIKQWVTEDAPRSMNDVFSPKRPGSSNTKGLVSTDMDMLRTYSLGLLLLALTTGGSIIEEVLAAGVAGKLMQYLRLHVLKETKDWATCENRNSGSSALKLRDDVRSRAKLPLEASQTNVLQAGNECLESAEKLSEREMEKNNCSYDADDDGDRMGDEKSRRREKRDGKGKMVDSNCANLAGKDGSIDEALRGEPSKRKGDARDRGSSKVKGRGKIIESTSDGNKDSSTPSGGGRIGFCHDKTKSSRENDARTETGSFLAPIAEGANTCEDISFVESEKEADDQFGSIIVGEVDISTPVRKAARAAETEAKSARASLEAVKTAGEAAVDLVKAAALEALGQSLDQEAVLAAAMSAAVSVEDAAAATKVMRRNLLVSTQATEDSDKEEADLEFPELRDCALSHEALTSLRERFSVQCLQRLGEYQEVLGPVLHERGVDVCLALLQRESASTMFMKPKALLPDVLKLICALAAHRKFSSLFVDRGGVQLILAAPRNSQTYTGISLCLFAFASVQGVMERVCTAPTEVVNEVVSLALHVLECVQDPARRNAVLFFGASFVFRAILDAFDAQEGLRKMINLLQNAVSLRTGGNSGLPGTSRTDRAASAEVLTSSEKQIAFHTCVALRQYFRAHLLILVDSIRPNKGRSGVRILSCGRASYKPLDISNEAIESLVLQIQRDRKLGPAFVRARWQALEKFMSHSGHSVLLELIQVGLGERHLYDIAQHALGVLQIITFMPSSRRSIISSTLSNDRSSMAVILDAANGTPAESEVIQAALLVLVNLVCPPPSLSSRLNQPSTSSQTSQQLMLSSEGRERHGKGDNAVDRSMSDRSFQAAVGLSEGRESVSKGDAALEKVGALSGNNLGTSSPAAMLVGDRRISLGSVAGGSGIAAYIEQGFRQARDAVRANNGIKVLLHVLHPRALLPPTSLDCIRALACRVLLGLARDDAIAHILTKLQVGKLLSELLRDGGSHVGRTAAASGGGEQGRWHTELSQVSMELIALVTNAGRASTLATSDAAAPTLRRIERAAIAAATPISYPSRELLQLIHEHLVLSGLPNAASTLLKEAHLAPLRSIAMQGHSVSQSSALESSQHVMPWPAGRVSSTFLASKACIKKDEPNCRSDQIQGSTRKKAPSFSSSLQRTPQSLPCPAKNIPNESRDLAVDRTENDEEFQIAGSRLGDSDYGDAVGNSMCGSKLLAKRKFVERENIPTPSKRLATADREGMPPTIKSPAAIKSSQAHGSSNLSVNSLERDALPRPDKCQTELPQNDDKGNCSIQMPLSTPTQPQTLIPLHANLQSEPQSLQSERATLDSLVVQYLKHQHRQCPAPITTLPPLSLFHPHVCPEPSRASYAPYNLAARLAAREVIPPYGGAHGWRRDKHFIYSRFRPLRPCRDDRILLTSNTFLGTTFRLAAGSYAGEIRIFDCHSGDVLETHVCHQSSITLLQSSSVQLLGSSVEDTGTQPGYLLLSSGSFDVRLWNSSALSEVPLFSFDGCRSARFNNNGDMFAAISSDPQRDVLLYDVQTGQRQQKLSDTSSSAGILRGSAQCIAHFSPSDTLLLWNGVLWDHRISRSIHRFDQFTDYGGGGFHPAGNEVVINSEVWDLRSYKLLRSVPSLDQTNITFSATRDVIYAILRRNLDDITSALNPRRSRHPLASAFRTMDAVDYTDIATTSVDRCVLDLAIEPTDSLISVITLDGHDEMDAFAKLYEVGRRKPTDDDSDPDDGVETDDDEDSLAEEEAVDDDALHLDADDSDLDISNNDESGDEAEEDVDLHEEDDDDAVEVDGSIVEIITDGSDGEIHVSFSSDDDGSFGDYEEEDDDDFNDILEVFL